MVVYPCLKGKDKVALMVPLMLMYKEEGGLVPQQFVEGVVGHMKGG